MPGLVVAGLAAELAGAKPVQVSCTLRLQALRLALITAQMGYLFHGHLSALAVVAAVGITLALAEMAVTLLVMGLVVAEEVTEQLPLATAVTAHQDC